MLSPPPSDLFVEGLRSRIVEGRTLMPTDFRTSIIPLWVTLSSTAVRGNANFNLPSTQRFRIRQILPHIVPVNVTTAANAVSGDFTSAAGVVGGGDIADRLMALAMNCRISLQFNSRTYDVFPQFNFPLSDVQSFMGEGGLDLTDMPAILTQGTTIDMSAALSDTATAALITPVQYGLIFVGSYIRTQD